MSSSTATIPPAKALELHSVITLTEQGIASRVLAKTSGGNLTLFAFHAGHGLTKHHRRSMRSCWSEGTLTLTIGGTAVRATPAPSCACRPTWHMRSMRRRPPGCAHHAAGPHGRGA